MPQEQTEQQQTQAIDADLLAEVIEKGIASYDALSALTARTRSIPTTTPRLLDSPARVP